MFNGTFVFPQLLSGAVPEDCLCNDKEIFFSEDFLGPMRWLYTWQILIRKLVESGRTPAFSCQVYLRLHHRTTKTKRALEIYSLGNYTVNTTL